MSYESIAAEYYDSIRHPTCANFAYASAKLLHRWLPAKPEGVIADVGAGRSLVAAELLSRGTPLSSLVLVDSSPTMLEHSAAFVQAGARAFLADVTSLPFEDASVAFLVASLGDPYNTPEFWREVTRVLALSGIAIFTTPAHNWATTFRPMAGEAPDTANFVLRSGVRVSVPSLIYNEHKQCALVEQIGLGVLEVASIPISEIPPEERSPKLNALTSDASVVTGYLLRKKERA